MKFIEKETANMGRREKVKGRVKEKEVKDREKEGRKRTTILLVLYTHDFLIFEIRDDIC